MYLTVPGIVLRVTAYGDRDGLLTLLTPKNGRLTVKARGLFRKNSPLAAVCQPLVYGEFTLFEYRGYYTINEAHVLNFFQNLRKDLERLALASYFAQITETVSQEDCPTPELLSLLLNCIYGLSELDIPIAMAKSVFELRAACLSGYMPDLQGCHICGNPLPDRFDLSAGQLECRSCRMEEGGGIRIPISAGVLEAMRYICVCEPKRIFSFRLGDGELRQMEELTESYLTTQLERSFSSLVFYKSFHMTQGQIEGIDSIGAKYV